MDCLANKKILIVSDSGNLLRCVNLSLQRNGCQTILARDAVKAVGLAMFERPDLILIDTELHIGDSDRITAHLKSVHETSTVPIIMIQKESSSRSIEPNNQCQLNAFIQSPFDTQKLLDTIQSVFQISSSTNVKNQSRQDRAA